MVLVVDVAAKYPVTVGLVPWSTHPPTATLVVKATFDVPAAGTASRSALQEPLSLEQQHRGQLLVPSDFSPYKPAGCDVVLVGAAVSHGLGPLKVSIGSLELHARKATELGPLALPCPSGDPTDPSVVRRWASLPKDAFHVARAAQRVVLSEGPVGIRIEHASVGAWFQLPQISPSAVWIDPRGWFPAVAFPLRLDAILLDVVARRCSVLWRGWRALPEADVGLFAFDWSPSVDQAEAVNRWPRAPALLPSALRQVARPRGSSKSAKRSGGVSPAIDGPATQASAPAPGPAAAPFARSPGKTMKLSQRDLGLAPTSAALPFSSDRLPVGPAPWVPASSARPGAAPASFEPEETASLSQEDLESELERTHDVDAAARARTAPRARGQEDVRRDTLTGAVAVPSRPLPFESASSCEGARGQTVTGVRPDLAPPLPFVLASGPSSVPLGYTALSAKEPPPAADVAAAKPPSVAAPSQPSLASSPSFLKAERAPSAPAPAAPPKESPRIQGLTIEEYAAVKAALWSPSAPRRETLKRHGMSELRWRVVEREWERSLEASKPEVVRTLVTELERAVQRVAEAEDAPTE